jgi:two-component sensor histidine kinase
MQQWREDVGQVIDLPKQTRGHASSPAISEQDVALLLDEVNHRIRNVLAMVEALIGQTRSTTLEEYRAELIARISALCGLYEVVGWRDGEKVDFAQLLEATLRPYCARGARVVSGGPRLQLEPKLAFALHLVFHELATNASKHGALSSALGSIAVRWEIKHVPGPAGNLTVVWSEHGGPEVKHPRQRGFGFRLITRALDPHGEVQLRFEPTGLVCSMLIDVVDDAISEPTFGSSDSSL